MRRGYAATGMDRRVASPRALELIPGLLAVAVFAAWSWLEGGFDPTSWYPGALFLLGLLLLTGFAVRGQISRIPRLSLIAAGLLAAYTLWSYLSIAWADVPADAWDGANRTLLYLTVYALFILPRWRSGAAAVIFALHAVAVGAVAALTVIVLVTSSDITPMFIDGRLIEPAGYQNAVAALFIGGAWPALLLSSRRETPWPLRALLLAIAGLLVQVAVLPQSRGAALVLPFAPLLWLAIVPSRLRVLAVLVPLTAVTLLTAPRLLAVYDAVHAGRNAGPTVDRAAVAIGLGCLALLIVGAGLAVLDRRARLPARVRELAGRAILAIGCLGALAGVVVALAAIGNPVSWAGDRFEDFKGGYDDSFEQNRFSGDLGSNRYDFWRVGIATTLADSPIGGAGADNFATDYLRERRSDEEPHYPHSLPVRVLAGTGLVGGLLFAGFLGAAVLAASRSLRGQPPGLGRALAATMLAAVAYWFMHSAGDWLYSFPAVTAPAFAWLGLSAAMTPAAGGQRRRTAASSGREPAASRAVAGERQPRFRGRRRWLAAAAATAITAGAALSLLAPWLSALYVKSATGRWIVDPAGAYSQLDRARSLNPLSAQPDMVGGAIAGRYEDLPEAEERFRAALAREPENWYAMLELAVARALAGDRREAVELLTRAKALNPLDPLIGEALRRVKAGRVVTFSRIDRGLAGRLCERLGPSVDPARCGR